MENKISIAPMVDRTDKNFRNFVRMINKDVLLYTEMITAQAILNGDLDYILGFNEVEHPIVLQIATSKPISIKHRIGIDGKNILPESFERTLLDKYEDMMNFINITRRAGVNKYIIHARIAILAGLDPKQNRTIPPLRYDEVYRVKNENPDLHIEINGGIKTIEEIDNHLKYVDSVMLGREVYDNPMILTEFGKYYGKEINITRKEIIEKMIYYVENMEKQSLRPHLFLMHSHGLFHNVRGSKAWKRAINEPKANSDTLRELLKGIENF